MECLSIECADEGHEYCSGLCVFWPCVCDCHESINKSEDNNE